MASIVVVDGGSSFGAELVGRLFGAGRDVLVAPSAEVALERIARFPPDVVFVCHAPPEQDGVQIAQAAQEAHPGVLVIVGGGGAAPEPVAGLRALFGASAAHAARAIMAAADARASVASEGEAETPIEADDLVDPSGPSSGADAPVPSVVMDATGALEPNGARGAVTQEIAWPTLIDPSDEDDGEDEDEDLEAEALDPAPSEVPHPSLVETDEGVPPVRRIDMPDVTVRPRAVSTAGAPRWQPGQFDGIAASDLFEAPSASPLDASFFDGLGDVAPVPSPVEDALCQALVSEIDGAVAAAIVELEEARIVGVFNEVEFSAEFLDDLARVTATMFRGEAVTHIERTIFEGRGGEGLAPRYVRAVVLSTVHTHHVMQVMKEARFAVVLVIPTSTSLDETRARLAKLVPGIEANLNA